MVALGLVSLVAVLASAHGLVSKPTLKSHRIVNTALSASILETAAANGNFKTFLNAVRTAGLVDTLSAPGPITVFAPSDAAFARLPRGKVDDLMRNTQELKRTLLYHVHPGKLSPTRNGRTLDTMLIGEDGFPKQLTVKVTNWSCDVFIWGGQENPAPVSQQDILCDNGRIHVVEEVLLPYEGNQAPQITFIGKRDMTGDKTLQTGYYGDMKGTSPNPVDRWRPDAKFEEIKVGDTWVAAANWDFEKNYYKKNQQKEE